MSEDLVDEYGYCITVAEYLARSRRRPLPKPKPVNDDRPAEKKAAV